MRRAFFAVAAPLALSMACTSADDDVSKVSSDVAQAAACTPPSGRPVCLETGFCFENPRPHAELVRGIWASGEGDVWSAGGYVTHWDGQAWTRVVDDKADYWAVGGTSSCDLWFGGESELAHWNGTAIDARFPVGAIVYGMFAFASNDVWAVGERGLTLHWNGATWTEHFTPGNGNLFNVWGAKPDDVWASHLGTDGRSTVQHWDGTAWHRMTIHTPSPCPPNERILDTWGYAPDDGWFRCEGGSLHRWTGATFEPFVEPPFAGDVYKVWGRGGDAFAANLGGEIAHWYGTGWKIVQERVVSFWSFYGKGDRFFAGGDTGVVLTCAFGTPGCTPLDGGPRGAIRGLWEISSTDAFAVGDAILRYDGRRWNAMLAPEDAGRLRAVHGTSATDVWAVGDAMPDASPVAVHFDGAMWKKVPLPEGGRRFRAIWARGADDVWIMGDAALHWDGAQWMTVLVPQKGRVNAIFVEDASSAIAAGAGGTLLRFDGTRWAPEGGFPESVEFKSVWGPTRDRIYAVGMNGAESSIIARLDGGAWNAVDNPPFFHLFGIGGSAPDDLWAMGNMGFVYHSTDGVTWTESHEIYQTFETVLSTRNGVLAAGTDGVVLRRAPKR